MDLGDGRMVEAEGELDLLDQPLAALESNRIAQALDGDESGEPMGKVTFGQEHHLAVTSPLQRADGLVRGGLDDEPEPGRAPSRSELFSGIASSLSVSSVGVLSSVMCGLQVGRDARRALARASPAPWWGEVDPISRTSFRSPFFARQPTVSQ